MPKKIIVTGGAGFIGSSLIRHLIQNTKYSVINIDKLTYAGNLSSLSSIEHSDRYYFENIDICSSKDINVCFHKYKPDAIIHLAAETHVDRSIDGPEEFISSNINGTFTLLEQARFYWSHLEIKKKKQFRFHHVSTDEVFGDLNETKDMFTENTPYNPSSPYSASKASSDHLVRAWGRTYGLPILITNCSNNYGPYQFPEKLIPKVITNALLGKKIPVFGSGQQIRDWLFVDDHAKALIRVIEDGKIGDTYNIGGHNEKSNIYVIKSICKHLDDLASSYPKDVKKYDDLISFVKDRQGGDVRYAIDAGKIAKELDWVPDETFETGLRKTVEWYLSNDDWWSNILNDSKRT